MVTEVIEVGEAGKRLAVCYPDYYFVADAAQAFENVRLPGSKSWIWSQQQLLC